MLQTTVEGLTSDMIRHFPEEQKSNHVNVRRVVTTTLLCIVVVEETSSLPSVEFDATSDARDSGGSSETIQGVVTTARWYSRIRDGHVARHCYERCGLVE